MRFQSDYLSNSTFFEIMGLMGNHVINAKIKELRNIMYPDYPSGTIPVPRSERCWEPGYKFHPYHNGQCIYCGKFREGK